MKITGPILRELLSYNPATGQFTWLRRSLHWFKDARSCASWNGKWDDKPAGRVTNGYVVIRVLDKDYYGHRLAWMFMKDAWPLEIDHDDRDGTNNRWDNIADTGHLKNSQNKGVMSTNTSGYPGVTRSLKKWQAKIMYDGVETYLGTFGTPEEASAVYQAAKMENVG